MVAASVVTLFAFPSLWLMNRDDPTGPATVAPAAVVVGPEVETAVAATAAPRSMGSAGGSFLEVPEMMPERSDADEPIAVAVPAARPGVHLSARATYRRSIPGIDLCLVVGAPQSSRVTVTNVDNGRSFTCVAAVPSPGSRDDVVLHTDAFTRIADLSDAPIPVEITW